MSDKQQERDSRISRREFSRLAAVTAGVLSLPGAASAGSLSSSETTDRYEYVVNHTEDSYEVATLIRFSDTSGFTELDALGINYRSTTASKKPHAHAKLSASDVTDVVDLSESEQLSHSPGSNPFWRLGLYPNGVFPPAKESTGFIDYEQMADGLRHLESNNSNRLNVYSIGESPGHYNYVSGAEDPKDVYVAEVTNDVDDDASFEAKEKVMYSLSLHGLERAGAEGGSRFIEDLLKGEEPEVEGLLDDLVLVFVYPNPDGWVAKHPQYESGWQLLGPEGGAPVAPFYERGNAGVYDTNRQYPSTGWINPAHYPAEPLGANLVDDEGGVDSDTPAAIQERVPDALNLVEHFREYANLNYGADLHGALHTSKFVLGLISQDQFDHDQLHELYQMNRVIDDELEAALDTWTTLADAQQRLTGEINPELIGFETLPEQAFDYAGIWDTIGYTVSGAMGDWMSHPEEFGGLGMTTMDFEMAYSHMLGANVFDPELVEMQVTGYTTAIRTMAKYATENTEATVDTGGDTTAYVTTDSLTRSSSELSFVQNPDKGFVEMNAGEQFSGTIGPGVTGAEEVERHQFTAVSDADRIAADLSWTPPGQDLEFAIEDADGNVIAESATADNPESLLTAVEAGASYTFVVSTWANVAADYTIDATYYDYATKSTTTESSSDSTMLGPGETTEFYADVREEVEEFSVQVKVQPGTLNRAKLKRPDGTIHAGFDDGDGVDEEGVGTEGWVVDDPAAGEWTVVAENVMESKDGETEVRFATLASDEAHPDPKDAIGYEQRTYEVDPLTFFQEYGQYADAAVDPLTVADVKAGDAAGYDNLVVIHDDSISDADYVDALDAFVADGGNLVLTDTGTRLLAPMENDHATAFDAADVSRETFYIAHLGQRYPGHALLEDTRPIQQQLWKIAGMGYSTANQAPMSLLDAETFDAAGGTVAGETDGAVAAGSITDGLDDGTGIHVIGSLLPPAKQTNLHPFGVLDYSVAFLGHTMLTNALGYTQTRTVNGDTVATFGGAYSVEPSVTATRHDDGDLFTTGEETSVTIDAEGNTDALLRDSFPDDWTVTGGDPHTTYDSNGRTYIEFDNATEDGSRSYTAAAPTELTGARSDVFGPVEYSLDGGSTWTKIPDTKDRNNVVSSL